LGCNNNDEHEYNHHNYKIDSGDDQNMAVARKMEWTILIHNGKKLTKMCSGGKYSSWYTEFGTGCSLPPGTYTLYCKDKKGFGWSGVYLKIKNKHLCKDFTWSGKQKKVTFKI